MSFFCVYSSSRVENEEMAKKLDSTFYYRPRSFFFFNQPPLFLSFLVSMEIVIREISLKFFLREKERERESEVKERKKHNWDEEK